MLKSLPPAAAADLAFKIFCTPSLSDKKAPNHRVLVDRARFHLLKAVWKRVTTTAGEVQTYTFEPRGLSRGTVLMVHGWTSEASFMCALAEQIRRAGFRVVLFDFPAHGLSAKRTTDLFECARATLEIGRSVGPLTSVVAHSFGCVAALLAAEGRMPMRGRLDTDSIVLIASPNKVWDVAKSFADRWELDEQTRRNLRRRLERIALCPLTDFTTAKLLRAVGRSSLVIHCRDDAEFPIECAQHIAASPLATLNEVQGLGHRNLLFAPPVIRSVVSFLDDGLLGNPSLEAAE